MPSAKLSIPKNSGKSSIAQVLAQQSAPPAMAGPPPAPLQGMRAPPPPPLARAGAPIAGPQPLISPEQQQAQRIAQLIKGG